MDKSNPDPNELHQPDDEEDEVFDEDEQYYNNTQLPGTGNDELIQPMLDQEDHLNNFLTTSNTYHYSNQGPSSFDGVLE